MVRVAGTIRTGSMLVAAIVSTSAQSSAVASAGDAPAITIVLPAAGATLPAFTPLKVMLNEEISSQTAQVGDPFTITVLHDVIDQGTIVIPRGAIGHGEVTFASRKGGFGKPGIIGIALRSLTLGNRQIDLDGRYREEGRNNNGAVAATWFAVGIFSGFIKGRAGFIEKGRELRARTGQPITFAVGQNAAAIEPSSAAATGPTVARLPITNGGN